MLTLHNATEEAKDLVKFGVVLIVFIIGIVLLFPFGKGIYNTLFPKPISLPAAQFGKLPHIIFPENSLQKDFSYTIDTLPGVLPTFADRIDVYQIPAPQPNLLALERAKARTTDVGFTGDPLPLTDSLYQWTDASVLKKQLDFDILSLNFALGSLYLAPDASISATALPFDVDAISMATSFISKLSSFPGDIDQGKTTTTYYAIADDELQEVPTRDGAQTIRVSFFQKDLAEHPVYYPDAPFSNMNLLIGGSEQFAPTVLGGIFAHYTTDASSAYGIKTANQAFEDLKNKKGFIASYAGSSDAIEITDVKLGYYAPVISQGYLLPIIVFKGNDGFLGYVEAVSDNYLTN